MFETTRPSHDDVSELAASADALPRDRDLQRASGLSRIVLRGTDVVDVYQKFPARIMFPIVGDGSTREAVVINAAGGIAGGDRLQLDITALGNARLAVTSQAAEKIYRGLDEPARIVTRLKAHATAKLAWLPQETIIFNAARIHRQTEIDLCAGAEVMALEWLVLGRAAHGEEVVRGHIRDRWLVRKDGRLVWADTFLVAEETFPHLRRRALLAESKAIGTLLYFGADLAARLEMLRDVARSLACHCAVTIVSGLVVVRFAAEASSDLKAALTCILQHFASEHNPGPFRVPKMWSC